MFAGVEVAVEGEAWMVPTLDKCYRCIYERENLLDVIIGYLLGILQVKMRGKEDYLKRNI